MMRATPWWSARHGAGIGSQFIESRLIHRSTPIEEREEKQNVNRGWCAVERCGGFDAANATFAFAGDNGWLSRIHVWVLLINQAQTPRDDPNNVHRPIALKPKLVVLEEIWMVGFDVVGFLGIEFGVDVGRPISLGDIKLDGSKKIEWML